MNPQILLRTNGNSSIGLGHIYRMIAFAEILNTKYEILIIIEKDAKIEVIPKWINTKVVCNKKQEIELMVDLFAKGAKLIVCDGYQFDSNYQKTIKSLGFNLLYIDDLTNEFMYADAVINHSPGITKKDYIGLNSTKYYLGLKYVLIREPFLSRKTGEETNYYKETVFLNMGGSDPTNRTMYILKTLVQIVAIHRIIIVVGSAYRQYDELLAFTRNNQKVELFKDLSVIEIKRLMSQSSLAIVPASTILYELSSLGVVPITGYFVANQKRVYQEFINLQLAFDLGDLNDITQKDLKENLNHIIKKRGVRELILRRQKDYFDGKSINRLRKIIKDLIQ